MLTPAGYVLTGLICYPLIVAAMLRDLERCSPLRGEDYVMASAFGLLFAAVWPFTFLIGAVALMAKWIHA